MLIIGGLLNNMVLGVFILFWGVVGYLVGSVFSGFDVIDGIGILVGV